MQRAKEPAEIVRDWLAYLKAQHKLRSDREIATRSGISPTTIYRWLDEDATFVMSLSKLTKVADAFGETLPAGLVEGDATGFSEAELSPFLSEVSAPPKTPDHNHGRWQLNSLVLNLEGFRPGDILDFRLGEKAQRGDIVVAQIRDTKRGTAETVLRLYQPPFLLTRSSDESVDPSPVMVDDENVYIMGVFDMMVRRRAA